MWIEVGEAVCRSPFFEPSYALVQVASSLIFRIDQVHDLDLRQGMAKQLSEMGRESAEGVIAAFEAVDKDEEQRLLHPELMSSIMDSQDRLSCPKSIASFGSEYKRFWLNKA